MAGAAGGGFSDHPFSDKNNASFEKKIMYFLKSTLCIVIKKKSATRAFVCYFFLFCF